MLIAAILTGVYWSIVFALWFYNRTLPKELRADETITYAFWALVLTISTWTITGLYYALS